jgi:hypothetical protein
MFIMENEMPFASERHEEAVRLIGLARSMLDAGRDNLAVTYLDLAIEVIPSGNTAPAFGRADNAKLALELDLD